ncbi:MAG: DUF362 domain-containing protein [Gemmatimonadetes bacterium]|nr:DUF362 domain-containing protein [Gemmatimonadota bacterium]MBT6150335.1 DUF362 domain-containing protein [Gemmatimonadota bacterium]MBT7859086.1 DUF362 domain-containing protein [Gemmatimonadota bacterium]
MKDFSVRAVHCDHRASDEEVYQSLVRATAPLSRAWDKLQKADRIAIKFNMAHLKVPQFEGRRRELVDEATARAVLRLLRERTTASLVATDTHGFNAAGELSPYLNYLHLLQEFGVEYAESNLAPFAEYEVPGGGYMFQRYTLNECFREADEVISVAKMKNHGFMGLTLCTKNLFGITPTIRPQGRVRSYYHHAIRLCYVLPDLARITNPCLNIIDALTGQWGCEWDGEGRVCDALIAGDQIIATDAVGAHLMGHDPTSDWPSPPFRRDRNHLLIAAQGGFGTVDLKQIDWVSEVTSPLNEFDSITEDSAGHMATVRETACEQGLYYRDHSKELIDRYAGDFVYLQDGEVKWSGPDPSHIANHRDFAGSKPGSALFLKLVDPDEHEGEHFDVYEDCLQRLRAEA